LGGDTSGGVKRYRPENQTSSCQVKKIETAIHEPGKELMELEL